MLMAAWALLALVAYATISPIQHRPTLPMPVTWERFGIFVSLGILFCLAYPRHLILVCLIVFGGAATLEFLQLLTPDRHGQIIDLAQKIAGGVAGIGLGQALLRFPRWFRRKSVPPLP